MISKVLVTFQESTEIIKKLDTLLIIAIKLLLWYQIWIRRVEWKQLQICKIKCEQRGRKEKNKQPPN